VDADEVIQPKAPNPEADKNVRAFLKLIRWAEYYPNGGLSDSDYFLQYGNNRLTDLSDHPRQKITKWGKTSTAAGAYGITEETWDQFKKKLKLEDFKGPSQDQVAIALIREVKALALIRQGKIEEAIPKLTNRWSSLPGAAQARKEVTMESARKQFQIFKEKEQ